MIQTIREYELYLLKKVSTIKSTIKLFDQNSYKIG